MTKTMPITGGKGKHVFRAKFTDTWSDSIWYYFRADRKDDVEKVAEELGFFKRWDYFRAIEYVK